MTTTDVARRDTAAPDRPSAALAIRPGQSQWDEFQVAALAQLGLADASDGDRAVFLHQCQRTGLDPFARQIYCIGRNEKKSERRGNAWVDTWTTRWTIQTGIDGWRVIRGRAEQRYGVRSTLGRAVWYDADGNEYKVWVRQDPPAACEITLTVVDSRGTHTPYTSVLMFREYVQTKNDRPVAQWATKPAHMLEKCTEADVYRKAFPQDFSGIELDDAMPPPEAAPAAAARPVARGEIVRERPRQPAGPAPATGQPAGHEPAAGPATTAAEDDAAVPPTSPAGPEPASTDSAGTEVDKDAPGSVSKPQLTKLGAIFTEYGFRNTAADREGRLVAASVITGRELTSSADLSLNEARKLIDTLESCGSRDKLMELLGTGVREDGDGDG